MATPTDDPTMETCGDVSESDPTMETIGVLSDVPMVSRNHHIGVASANFKVPGPPRIPIRIKRGPWGGNGGTPKEMEGKSQRLESLTIYHHGVVEGFQFSYIDEDGQIRTAGPWGQNRNLFIHQVSRFHTLPCMCVRLFCKSCWLMPAFIIEKTRCNSMFG